MSKSGQSFNKKEIEKKKAKARQDKAEKMGERKANAKKGKSLDEMMAYLDENGNLSTTPPDPSKKKEFSQDDIVIGTPKYVPSEEDTIRRGVISFFNDAKGFGFINDLQSQERVFIHINQLTEQVREGDKVTFEVERGPKGLNAVNVKKAS